MWIPGLFGPAVSTPRGNITEGCELVHFVCGGLEWQRRRHPFLIWMGQVFGKKDEPSNLSRKHFHVVMRYLPCSQCLRFSFLIFHLYKSVVSLFLCEAVPLKQWRNFSNDNITFVAYFKIVARYINSVSDSKKGIVLALLFVHISQIYFISVSIVCEFLICCKL